MVLVTHVEIVVAVCAAADYLRHSHHRHAAAARAHVQVGTRDVLTQELLSFRIDKVLRNDVPRKRIANDLRIAGADGLRWIKRRVRMRAKRVIDCDAGHTEVTFDFVRRGHCVNHRHGLCMPQPFVVEKEKALVPRDRTAE